MLDSVPFVEAFLFKPCFGCSFMVRGRVYRYVDTVYANNDVLIVCTSVNSKGELVYKVLPQSKYCKDRIQFL